MKTLPRLLIFVFPLATFFTILSFTVPQSVNSLEAVTVSIAFFFVGFGFQQILHGKIIKTPRFRAVFSAIVFLATVPLLNLISFGEEVSGILLFIQGFLIQWNPKDLRPFYAAIGLSPLLALLVVTLSPAVEKSALNQITVHESVELDQSFRFTEESQVGALPKHRLFKNGHEKFNSDTEQVYGQCLVALPLQFDRVIRGGPKHIVIFGGADGLAARSALIFSSVKKITIIDTDKNLFNKARTESKFRIYNLDSLNNKRTDFNLGDPLDYVFQKNDEAVDIAIVDFPRTKTITDARLFSAEFLYKLKDKLSENGTIVIPVPKPLVRTVRNIANQLDLSVAAVKSKGSSDVILILVKTLEALGQPLADLLKWQRALPCEQLTVPEPQQGKTLSLSVLYDSEH